MKFNAGAGAGDDAHEIHYEETNWKARPDVSPDGSRLVFSSYAGRGWTAAYPDWNSEAEKLGVLDRLKRADSVFAALEQSAAAP
jgi:Tol biopolymer transport system component